PRARSAKPRNRIARRPAKLAVAAAPLPQARRRDRGHAPHSRTGAAAWQDGRGRTGSGNVEATATRANRRSWLLRALGAIVFACAIVVLVLMWWWDYEPAHFDVGANAQRAATERSQPMVTGSATTAALM